MEPYRRSLLEAVYKIALALGPHEGGNNSRRDSSSLEIALFVRDVFSAVNRMLVSS